MKNKRRAKGLACVLSIEDMPEVLATMRHELANVVRAEAESEGDPRVARRLRSIADAFEAGQRPG